MWYYTFLFIVNMKLNLSILKFYKLPRNLHDTQSFNDFVCKKKNFEKGMQLLRKKKLILLKT
jgi:hypothetical protein